MERLSAAPYQDRRVFPALVQAPTALNAPAYNTCMGALTFEQLYHLTSRTVGYVMRELLGMDNPEDIDDCMQSGYLKVWQKLQAEPDWLVDKPKRYIVQAVILRSKAQRYSHLRHYRKISFDTPTPGGETHQQITTNQVDIWMDIAQALGHVAIQIEDDPLLLLSLYTLITDVKAVDVSLELGINYKTLAKRRPYTRNLLAHELAAYRPNGTTSENGSHAPTPKRSAPHTPRVAPWLLEDKPALWQVVDPAPDLQLPASAYKLEPHYPTHWGGIMTIEKIITDPQVQRAAFAKAGRLGLDVDDQADCVQRGCIKLWQSLQTDPKLLSDKGPQWVGIYLAYSGDPKQFHRHTERQQTFSDPAFGWQEADEYLRLGLQSANGHTHAQWTTEIDEQIDVTAFIERVRQHYTHCPRKWIAFQAIAGLISARGAAHQLGISEKNFAANIGNQVRGEVMMLLPNSWKATRSEPWEVQLARGEGVDHITEIANEVMQDERLLLALYVVTTSVTKKAVAQTFGYGLTAFGKHIRKIKGMIAAKYRHNRLK